MRPNLGVHRANSSRLSRFWGRFRAKTPQEKPTAAFWSHGGQISAHLWSSLNQTTPFLLDTSNTNSAQGGPFYFWGQRLNKNTFLKVLSGANSSGGIIPWLSRELYRKYTKTNKIPTEREQNRLETVSQLFFGFCFVKTHLGALEGGSWLDYNSISSSPGSLMGRYLTTMDSKVLR